MYVHIWHGYIATLFMFKGVNVIALLIVVNFDSLEEKTGIAVNAIARL